MMVAKVARSAAGALAAVAVTASVTAGAVSAEHRATTLTAPVTLSATVLAMGGLGYETVDPDLIKQTLGGRFANDTVIGLPWPGQMAPFNGDLTLGQSAAVGLDTMAAAVRDTPGQKIVLGASGSTVVVDDLMRRLANDPNAPSPDEISFVVMGDANRGVFRGFQGIKVPIFDYVPDVPVTPYNVIVIKGEYDGIGDWPDRWWNVLAVANALAGTGLLQQILPEDIVAKYALEAFGSVHKSAMFADLSTVPAKNITVTTNELGGVTTTYLVPTADLPLLRPLVALGVSHNVIDTLEKVLRPIIDSAYIRNDPPDNGSSPRVVEAPAVDPAAGTGGAPSAAAVRAVATARVSGSGSALVKRGVKALAVKPAAASENSAPTAPHAGGSPKAAGKAGVGRSGRSG